MKPGVLVVAREAGAAAALAPVVRELHEMRRHVVAYDAAAGVLGAAGIEPVELPAEPPAAALDDLLERGRIGVVLTGTSLWPNRDAAFWEAGRRRGVPTVAVLDHWCNYAERFTYREPLDSLPDTIAVMDAAAADALVRVGVDRARLVVTGQPYFDALPRVDRVTARRALDASERTLVVFASEPQRTHWGAHEPRDPGFGEHEVLAAVLEAAAAAAPDALVLVKPHPLEDPAAFAQATGTAPPDARVVTGATAELVAAADVVVGMSSLVLLEAGLAGTPALSVRPGGEPIDFVGLHRDLIDEVTRREDIEQALRRAIARGRRPAPDPRFAGSVLRVADLVRGLARGA